MSDDFAEAWERLRVPRVPMLADDLVTIGVQFGVEFARRVYYALASEPVTVHHERVDWVVIQSRIYAQRGH